MGIALGIPTNDTNCNQSMKGVNGDNSTGQWSDVLRPSLADLTRGAAGGGGVGETISGFVNSGSPVSKMERVLRVIVCHNTLGQWIKLHAPRKHETLI